MMPRQAIRPVGGGGKHLFANFPGQKPDFKRLYMRIARIAPFPSPSREMPRNASTPWNAGQIFYRNLRTKVDLKRPFAWDPSMFTPFFKKGRTKIQFEKCLNCVDSYSLNCSHYSKLVLKMGNGLFCYTYKWKKCMPIGCIYFIFNADKQLLKGW